MIGAAAPSAAATKALVLELCQEVSASNGTSASEAQKARIVNHILPTTCSTYMS